MSLILGRVPRFLSVRLATVAHAKPKPKATSLVRLISQNAAASSRSTEAKDLPLAYTWLTRTPGQITPDDVLSSVSPIPESLSLNSVPVLLVTSAFAHWIDVSSNRFLEQLINSLYPSTPNHESSGPLHAIVAVVDKLPDLRARLEGLVDSKTSSDSDGVSFLLVKADSIQGTIAAPRRVRNMEAAESSLVFTLQHNTYSKALQRSTHELGLRLANTIFINGNDTTLFATRWTYTPSQQYTLEQSVNLSNCTVTSAVASVQNSFNLPLYPVGQRRRVISSMGNILRQLAKHLDSQSTEPMPASSELEKELPRYIEEHGIVDRRVSVWALIENSEKGFQLENNANMQESLVKAIRAGGKLHRVMSGGGGWGKKQGLLSLDPETTFIETDNNQGRLGLDDIFADQETQALSDISTPPPAFFEMPQLDESMSNLSQAAGPGDYIQFFVSVESDPAPNPSCQEGSIRFNFGIVADSEVIPSSSDGVVKDLGIVPQFFGALSEKAITYSQPVVGPEASNSLKSSAKFDIPGCHVALVVE
ncbi:uncharacterized protein BO87DRAFT_319340 [Aspergillus neoniger CBS 115656]|uniref:V-type ATPase n=1 Tax=Aspergillus neoniger (strain CBS 115656) TaxID=1448310 RepID=A0A318YMY0_ASPNB|nr:V-type ATPase [Aspergillus neoniger CBS 115656]PYH29588.1 V-type ATPase [Aspergillus neoniger CBS 115656]